MLQTAAVVSKSGELKFISATEDSDVEPLSRRWVACFILNSLQLLQYLSNRTDKKLFLTFKMLFCITHINISITGKGLLISVYVCKNMLKLGELNSNKNRFPEFVF